MKAQLICNGKTVEVEVADEQFEKLFAEKKTGYERVKLGTCLYHYIDSKCEATFEFDTNYKGNNQRYNVANYFSDQEVANNMARAQRLWNLIHRRAVELCEPIKMYKDQRYWTITFNPLNKTVRPIGWSATRVLGAVYFDTEEHCQQVIDEFRDELLWYFTEFKDRADM